MNKDEISDLIHKGLSQRAIAEHFNTSQTNIRYWLKKFDMTTNIAVTETERYCPRCTEHLPLQSFYNRRGSEGCSSYCKKCTTEQVVERQQRLKQELVDYKGGQCSRCGYNKCNAALEFHHRNPDEKDFTLSKVKTTVFNDKIKSELDKCDILCSNCHREVHQLLGLSSNG